MGHSRLGPIPKTRKWTAVVACVTGESAGGHFVPRIHAAADVSPQATGARLTASHPTADYVAAVAGQALAATERALNNCVDDVGFRYTFYLLARLALAARSPKWEQDLERLGIRLPDNATIFDLTVEVQGAVDRHIAGQRFSSDVAEFAQAAAGEALTSLAGSKATTLFGPRKEDLRAALRQLSTKRGFGLLGQRFFAHFMARFLNFYLSRITAARMGSGMLHQVGDLSNFNSALGSHCVQSARIVRDFCAEWYSKTEFQEGIDISNSSRFLAVALKKLVAELQSQRAEA